MVDVNIRRIRPRLTVVPGVPGARNDRAPSTLHDRSRRLGDENLLPSVTPVAVGADPVLEETPVVPGADRRSGDELGEGIRGGQASRRGDSRTCHEYGQQEGRRNESGEGVTHGIQSDWLECEWSFQ